MAADGLRIFDPKTTEKPRCPACKTTAKNLCRHDAELEQGMDVGRRPKGCIAGYDPTTAPFPDGF